MAEADVTDGKTDSTTDVTTDSTTDLGVFDPDLETHCGGRRHERVELLLGGRRVAAQQGEGRVVAKDLLANGNVRQKHELLHQRWWGGGEGCGGAMRWCQFISGAVVVSVKLMNWR